MSAPPAGASDMEIWAGAESSHLRVGDRVVDQLTATGHTGRIADLDRLADIGVAAIRYPVLWGRSSALETDWDWADRRIGRLLELGIRPIIEFLHHGFGPVGLDPMDKDYPSRLAEFAGKVVQRYPGVREFLPVNEPLVTARFSGLYGHWWPHARDHRTFIRLLVQECLAISAASSVIREARPEGVIIVNEDVPAIFGTMATAPAVRFDEARRWLTWDLLLGRVDASHPMWPYLTSVPEVVEDLERLLVEPAAPDILGIDHYVISDRYLDHRLARYPVALQGGDGAIAYADVEAVRVEGIPIRPFQSAIAQTWDRYHRPVALTEVHLAGEETDQVLWWAAAISAARAALAEGIDIRAVTSWAVFGATDWDSLLTRSGGAVVPGAASGKPTALTNAIRASVAGAVPPMPAEQGWWQSPDRLQYRAPRLSGSR